MKEYNIWETKFKDNYLTFTTVESFFDYQESHNIPLDFIIKDTYTPGNDCESIIDNRALRTNTKITYTDKTHPIILDIKGPLKKDVAYINSSFFKEHINEFKDYAKASLNKQIAANEELIRIPDFIFDDDTLSQITTKEELKETSFFLKETNTPFELTPNQEEIIKDNHLQFKLIKRFGESKEISSKYVLSFYTIKSLKDIGSLFLTLPISDKEIDSFIYINEDATIRIVDSNNYLKDESAYYNDILHIINIIKSHHRPYNIYIDVKNRETFRRSGILDNLSDNINLTIFNDLYEYDLETYKEEEKKLNSLIKDIKDSDLSPFEKYIAAYNICKQFKSYHENEDNKDEARKLRYILNDDNDYLVCVGFSVILQELLNRLDIPNNTINVGIDVSYDNTEIDQVLPIKNAWHQRNIVKIDDPKYNIHGYYLADATWDNYMTKDIYTNSLITFNHKKEARRLENLTDIDLLFDFNDEEDFRKKLNHLLKEEINNNLYNFKHESYTMKKIKKIKAEALKKMQATNDIKEKIAIKSKADSEIALECNNQYKQAYIAIFKRIMNRLEILDYPKYIYYYNKYYHELTSNNNKELDTINAFLAEYLTYILPLTNKEIPANTIIEAAKNVKEKINKYSEEQITEWLEETKKNNQQIEKNQFPYKYDPSNKTEAYLETNEPNHIR